MQEIADENANLNIVPSVKNARLPKQSGSENSVSVQQVSYRVSILNNESCH